MVKYITPKILSLVGLGFINTTAKTVFQLWLLVILGNVFALVFDGDGGGGGRRGGGGGESDAVAGARSLAAMVRKTTTALILMALASRTGARNGMKEQVWFLLPIFTSPISSNAQLLFLYEISYSSPCFCVFIYVNLRNCKRLWWFSQRWGYIHQ